jgi:hypothetical protein
MGQNNKALSACYLRCRRRRASSASAGTPRRPQESAPQVGVKTIASCMPNGGLRRLRNVFGSSPALRSRRRRGWCPIPIRSLLCQPRGRHRHCETRPARCNQWRPGGKWSSPRFQPRPEHRNHTTSLERLSKENRRWRRSDRRQTHSPRRDTAQDRRGTRSRTPAQPTKLRLYGVCLPSSWKSPMRPQAGFY